MVSKNKDYIGLCANNWRKPVITKPITPRPGTSQSSAPVETPKSTKRKFNFQPLSTRKRPRFQFETDSDETQMSD